MSIYQFEKPAIRVTTKGYWQDDVVPTIRVEADTIGEALNKWADAVEKGEFIKISKSARKNPQPMYVDTKDGKTKRIGYVVNGSTQIQTDSGEWKHVNLTLWTRVDEIKEVWNQ